MDKDVIDAEYRVVGGEPPLKWWQGWRIEWSWTPWPAIGAAVLAFAAFLSRGG